jgi:hypothetical protein
MMFFQEGIGDPWYKVDKWIPGDHSAYECVWTAGRQGKEKVPQYYFVNFFDWLWIFDLSKFQTDSLKVILFLV